MESKEGEAVDDTKKEELLNTMRGFRECMTLEFQASPNAASGRDDDNLEIGAWGMCEPSVSQNIVVLNEIFLHLCRTCDHDEVLIVAVAIAVTILHEWGHQLMFFVCSKNGKPEEGTPKKDEFLFKTVYEAGFTVERALLGGYLDFLLQRRRWLTAVKLGLASPDLSCEEENRCSAIPMSWVRGLFSNKTLQWTRPEASTALGTFALKHRGGGTSFPARRLAFGCKK
jgi:hypothetical protein